MAQAPVATILIGPNELLLDGLSKILNDAGFHTVISAPAIDDDVLTYFETNAVNIDQQKLLVIDRGKDLTCLVHEIALFRQKHPSTRIVVLTKEQSWSTLRAAVRGSQRLSDLCFELRKIHNRSTHHAWGNCFAHKIVAQMLEQHQNHDDPIGEGDDDQAPPQLRILADPTRERWWGKHRHRPFSPPQLLIRAIEGR